MRRLDQQGLVHFLLPVILLIGIAAGVYLISNGNPLKFFSRASNEQIVFKSSTGESLQNNSKGLPQTFSASVKIEFTSSLGPPVFAASAAPSALYCDSKVDPFGMVGYWKFDETSGATATDSSGSGNNGTVSGTSSALGLVGNARSFNGRDSVNMGNPANGSLNFGSGDFTMTAWINPTNLRAHDANPIFSKNSLTDGGLTGRTAFRYGLNDKGNFMLDATRCAQNLSLSTPFTSNSWQQITIVNKRNKSLTIYRNGENVGMTKNCTYPSANSEPFVIGQGRFSLWDYYWKGAIDNVIVYKRALSDSEIASLYNSGKGCEISPSAQTSGTVSYKFAEDPADLDKAVSYPYTTHPMVQEYTFKDQTPGIKFIWVEFKDVAGKTDRRSAQIELTSAPALSCNDSGSGLQKDLAGYWKFDETSGTVAADSSGSGNNGAANGASSALGLVGNARSFSGKDSVSMGNPANGSLNFGSGDFTLTAWINPANLKASGYNPVFSKNSLTDGSLNGRTGFRYGLNDSGNVMIDAARCADTIPLSAPFTSNSWQQITLVNKRNNSLDVYRNGQKVGSTKQCTYPSANSEPFIIGQGRISQWDYYWKGAIDNVIVYKRALSDSEISALYNSGKGCEINPSASVQNSAPSDLDVIYISRTPRYKRYELCANPNPYLCGGQTETDKRWPADGDTVTFTAKVVNHSPNASGAFVYKWFIDGQEAGQGSDTGIAAGSSKTFNYSWVWKSNDHKVKFVADTGSQVTETSETNNSIEDYVNSLSLRIHVENSVYNRFNSIQNVAGTKSFEDWVQYQVRQINDKMAQAGGNQKVRIDEIVTETDNSLPVGEVHAPLDMDWDGRWGFGVPEWITNNPAAITTWAPQVQWALVHELGHQLGLIDGYRLNYDWNDIRKNDAIPVCAGFPGGDARGTIYEKCMYYNPNIAGIMASPDSARFVSFESQALNSNLGKRRGYFGDYLYDIPAVNTVQIIDSATSAPLASAQLSFYQTSGNSNGNTMPNSIVFSGTTDGSGKFTLPNRSVTSFTTATGHTLKNNPFGQVDNRGFNGIFLIKVEKGGSIGYAWLDISSFNLAFWAGQTASAQYQVSVALSAPSPTPAPIVVVSDHFDRSDSSSLGNADTGQDWTVAKGRFGLINNTAYSADGCPAPGYAVIDSSAGDGSIEVKLTFNAQDARIPFRYVDLNNLWWVENTGSSYELNKMKNGIRTGNLGGAFGPAADGDIIKIVLNGSTIRVYLNGVFKLTYNDSDFSTATKHGIGIWCKNTVRFDDFSVAATP